MCNSIFDYDDGAFIFNCSDNRGMDSDGNMMLRLPDNMAMDIDSGEVHITSFWPNDQDESI